jgi:hypothetical protein
MTRDDDHDEALELDALPDRFGDRLADLEELARRVYDGWVPFGWHAAYNVQLVFDGEDDSGDPVWERNAAWGLTVTEQEADRMVAKRRPACEGGLYGAPTDCKCATCEPTGRVGGAARPCCHTTGPLHHPACQERP